MKKIAIYTGYHFLEHSMTFVYRQLEKMNEQNIELLVLCTKRINKNEFSDIGKVVEIKFTLIDKIFVRVFSKKFALRSNFPPNQKTKVLKELRAFKPDLVYAFFGNNGIEILPVCKALNIELVVSFLGIDASTFLQSRFYCQKLNQLFAYAKIIVLSKNMFDKFIGLGCPKDRLFVNHLAIPLVKFEFVNRKGIREKRLAEEPIIFLQISRFFEKKGHMYTLKAFQKAIEFYPSLRLILGGDGPLLNQMQQLSNHLGFGDKVKFIGKVSHGDVIELMKQADVFVHHSIVASNGDQEGTPTAILEAMATGLPVISTFHAGIPEQVIDGETGFLVAEKDIENYAKKMIEILDVDSHAFAKKARAHIATHFNLETETENLINFFYAK